MFLSPVGDQDIIRTVQHLKNKMSTDCGGITVNMRTNYYFSNCKKKPFSYICNVSFQTGVFPNKMKIAKVVPLFKSG